MPGFNQQVLNSKVRSANATAILVGDQVVGFGQTANVSVNFGAEAFHGIGTNLPQEIQQLKISVSVTLAALQLTTTGLATFGQSTPWLAVLSNTQLSFHLIDNLGNSILTIVGCTAESYSESIPCNQPISEDVNFMALDILDANGNTYLAGSNAANFNALVSGALSIAGV